MKLDRCRATSQPVNKLFYPDIMIETDSHLQISFLIVLFRKIKANYRRDYPPEVKDFWGFSFYDHHDIIHRQKFSTNFLFVLIGNFQLFN